MCGFNQEIARGKRTVQLLSPINKIRPTKTSVDSKIDDADIALIDSAKR
jgi:hypothetical protein